MPDRDENRKLFETVTGLVMVALALLLGASCIKFLFFIPGSEPKAAEIQETNTQQICVFGCPSNVSNN